MKKKTFALPGALFFVVGLGWSPARAEPQETPLYKIKSAIVVLMHGVGFSHLSLLSTYARIVEKRTSIFDRLIREGRLALGDVSPSDALVPDVSAVATAFASGAKTRNGLIGKDGTGGDIDGLLRDAVKMKKSVGLITDLSLTHPLLASFYAHQAIPYDANESARVLANFDGIQILMGGGMENLIPSGLSVEKMSDVAPSVGGPSKRKDKENLWHRLGERGYHPVSKKAALLTIPRTAEQVAAVFSAGELPYTVDRSAEIPTLREMIGAAWPILARNPRGFLLIVAPGLTGSASAENDGGTLLRELLECEAAVDLLYARTQEGKEQLLFLSIAGTLEIGSPTFAAKSTGLPGAIEINPVLKISPDMNTIDSALLKQMRAQRRSLRSVVRSAKGSAKELAANIKKELNVVIPEERLAGALASGVSKERSPFYYGSRRTVAAVAHQLSDQTGLVWSSGTPQSQWIPVISYGPNMDQLTGVIGIDDVGRTITRAFTGVVKVE